jgi:hypothetical protein
LVPYQNEKSWAAIDPGWSLRVPTAGDGGLARMELAVTRTAR